MPAITILSMPGENDIRATSHGTHDSSSPIPILTSARLCFYLRARTYTRKMNKQTTTGSTHLLTYIHLDAVPFLACTLRDLSPRPFLSRPVRPVLSSRLRSVLSLREFTPFNCSSDRGCRFSTPRIMIYWGWVVRNRGRTNKIQSKVMTLYLFFKIEIYIYTNVY